MEEREIVIQERLGPKEKQTYFVFPKGKMIWPENSGRGVLEQDLQARKEKGKKTRNYQAWVAENGAKLYLDTNHWQLSPGFHFGAPVSSAKEVRIRQ